MRKNLIIAFLMLNSVAIFAGNEIVEGFVFKDKKAVPGVIIKNSANDKMVKTNKKGRFSIKGLSTEKDTIFVSGIIKNDELEIPLWSANLITVQITGNTVSTERSRRKVAPSPAYGGTMITREALETTGEINLLRAISLKTPGVEYANENLIIRGKNSINSSLYPLYILDGIETTQVSFLTVMEVETVEILKDASSSMFGVRGGNGVVIINRKK